MRDEISSGYMERAWGQPAGVAYYIPHHYVTKKFRVVNDASCKTTNELSLNDIQMIGPKIQHDLADQIMRFRRHKIGVIADIKKMFKQVKIDPSQWDLQRIFWREGPQDKLLEYWSTSINFGLSSSLHSSCRAMIQCGRDYAQQYPDAAKSIEFDFYVDDGLFGAESFEMTKQLCREIDLVLKFGRFELRNWASNSKDIEDLFESSIDSVVAIEEKDATKVLGLNWDKATDEFFIRVNLNDESPKTKRQLMSQFAGLYDPNGFVSPIIVAGKQIVQSL